MNVLIFVTVLLLVLSSLSYSELKIFYRQALSHAAWVRYMDTIEGCLFNNQVDSIYQNMPKKKDKAPQATDSLGHPIEKGEDKEAVKKAQSTGSKRINFRILIGQAKNITPDEESQFIDLIKNLLNELYGQADFFKDLSKKRQGFVDELLAAIKEDAADAKIKHAIQLNNLTLKDEELNQAFYFMLKDNPDEGKGKSPCAQVSLQDFLTDSTRTLIRVYLAPKEILLAAFKDPQIVDKILEKRQELYKQVEKKYPVEKATEDFKQAFEAYAELRDILDFSVTKTNPATYK